MKYVLAIDEGTTSTRCFVISAAGEIVGQAARQLTQFFPSPGWVEHDAAEIFDETVAAAREAIERAGVKPDVIGITNQRETIVVWNRRTGEPLARAIVWQDRRTAERCRELAASAPWITERTGLPIDPYFSGTKLELLLAEPAIAPLVESGDVLAGTIDSWLIWKLTDGSVHATDYTNASRTLLFDIDSRGWSTELCALLNVPQSVLPDVRASSGSFGIASARHLGIEMPICGVAGDQQAALFGQGCVKAGQGKNTYGTGAFLLLNTGSRRPAPGDGILATVACDELGGYAYALEGSIFIAGAAIQWMRDGLGLIETAAESEEMAKSIHSNEGVYFVPALTGLGAPHWEPDARGTIVGLTRGTGRAHLVRAALESMAYGTRDVLLAMRERSGVPFERLRVDGGASVNDWLMQFQADVIGVPVERPATVETTALGAAGLAGISAGVWSDVDEFLSVRHYTTFHPVITETERMRLLSGWGRAISATLSWARSPETQ